MITGLVLCGIVAVLLVFGVAERTFKSFGVAYWLGFVLLAVLIGCAFIPTFTVGTVQFNIAGFFAPLLFAAVFFALAVKTRESGKALVASSVTAAMSVAVWLLIEPITGSAVSGLIVGFLCGAVAFLVAKTRLSALGAVFLGMPIGEVVSSAVNVYVYGTPMRFGSAAAYDAIVLAAVFAVALFEAVAAIKRMTRSRKRAETAEIAEEFDPDEYKKYFDE